MSDRRCKDCVTEGITTLRNAPHPGPRCTTHHRAFRKAQKARQHEKYVAKTYGLTEGQYDLLYQWQGGRCAICRVATGRTKRLAVDHDHVSGLVRGLCCGPCNQQIGIWDVATLIRAIDYLAEPPAFDVIGKVKP